MRKTEGITKTYRSARSYIIGALISFPSKQGFLDEVGEKNYP